LSIFEAAGGSAAGFPFVSPGESMELVKQTIATASGTDEESVDLRGSGFIVSGSDLQGRANEAITGVGESALILRSEAVDESSILLTVCGTTPDGEVLVQADEFVEQDNTLFAALPGSGTLVVVAVNVALLDPEEVAHGLRTRQEEFRAEVSAHLEEPRFLLGIGFATSDCTPE
jgi:hypothetical protein